MRVCVDCESNNVHYIEFRTDCTNANSIGSINDGVGEITNNDLPYYLYGYYCHDCKTFCSIKEL